MVESDDDPNAKVVFETDDENIVAETVKALLETTPRNQIKIIKDIDWEIDILLRRII